MPTMCICDEHGRHADAVRAVKELREVRDRVLTSTNHLSMDAAFAAIEVAMRERAELRAAEEALGTALGSDGWRAVAAEVEAGRHLEQRVRAFAGVASGTSASLEAALRTLQHRERERLALIQLRNDVLAAASCNTLRATSGAGAVPGGAGAVPGGGAGGAHAAADGSEPNREAVRVVRDMLEHASAIMAEAGRSRLGDAITALRRPSETQEALLTARRRLRRLHAQMVVASRSLPAALHRRYLGDPAATLAAPPATHASAPGGAMPSDRSADDVPGDERGASSSRARSAAELGGGAANSVNGAGGGECEAGGGGSGGLGPEGGGEDELEGDEDTPGEEEEEEDGIEPGGQRAWRRQNTTLLAADGVVGAGAANVVVPRLALSAAGAPAEGATAAPTGGASSSGSKGSGSKGSREAGASGKASAASARNASPRRNVSGALSPRGSPPGKTQPATSRPHNSSGPGPKRPRPPNPATATPATVGGAPAHAAAAAAALMGNGVGGVVSEGLGAGLVSAWAREYQPTALLAIGDRTLVHEARRLQTERPGGGEDSASTTPSTHSAAALCAMLLDDRAWEATRDELRALTSLRHVSVMAVYAWYERRLPSAPGRPTMYEVSTAAQLLHGGDLMQRACAVRYTESHVRQLAAALGRGLMALHAAGVEQVDVAPWTLLYATPASAPLHEGIVLTNIGPSAARGPRGAEAPLRAAFDAPEVATGGGVRDQAAAVWALGRLVQLLLTGTLDAPPSQPEEAGGRQGGGGSQREGGGGAQAPGGGGGPTLSAAARSFVDALTQPAAIARPRAEDFLQLPWLVEGAGDGSDAVAGEAAAAGRVGQPNAKGGASARASDGAGVRPLADAHERLNRWYDEFLFEGMTTRLAEMADG